MQTLKVLFWNLVFLVLFGAFCFLGLEFYLRTYQSFNTETVSAVGVPIFQPDEVLTYAHQPRKMARNGYGIPTPEIFINQLGLRDDEDYDPRSSDRNVLMIGDSFTFGTGVDQNETFSEVLEQRLNSPLPSLSFDVQTPRGGLSSSLRLSLEPASFALDPSVLERPTWQVWNAGHIGHSLGQYYLLLKRYAELMPLDTVVVNIFVANDITELRRKDWVMSADQDLVRVQDQKVFANGAGQLESHTNPVPKWRAWHWLEQRLQVLRYKLELDDPAIGEPTLTWPVFLHPDHPANDPNLPRYWERFFQGMQLLADYASEKNIELHFVLIPMDVQVDDVYREKYARIYFDEEAKAADRPQRQIASFCAARQLSCLDLLPLFRQHPQRKQLFFNYNADPHFDRLGHQVTAEWIEQQLKD